MLTFIKFASLDPRYPHIAFLLHPHLARLNIIDDDLLKLDFFLDVEARIQLYGDTPSIWSSRFSGRIYLNHQFLDTTPVPLREGDMLAIPRRNGDLKTSIRFRVQLESISLSCGIDHELDALRCLAEEGLDDETGSATSDCSFTAPAPPSPRAPTSTPYGQIVATLRARVPQAPDHHAIDDSRDLSEVQASSSCPAASRPSSSLSPSTPTSPSTAVFATESVTSQSIRSSVTSTTSSSQLLVPSIPTAASVSTPTTSPAQKPTSDALLPASVPALGLMSTSLPRPSVITSAPAPSPRSSIEAPSSVLDQRSTVTPGTFSIRFDGLKVALERVRQGWIAARRDLSDMRMSSSSAMPAPSLAPAAMISARVESIERVQAKLLALRRDLLSTSRAIPSDSATVLGHSPSPAPFESASPRVSASRVLSAAAPTRVTADPSIGLPTASKEGVPSAPVPASWNPVLPSTPLPGPVLHYLSPVSWVPPSSAFVLSGINHLIGALTSFGDHFASHPSRCIPACHARRLVC
ncbi:hypothetical protein CF326_g9245 [Tilletia indica]|nr:hypothetical protein CF326_g9245 [Tilletia indica]